MPFFRRTFLGVGALVFAAGTFFYLSGGVDEPAALPRIPTATQGTAATVKPTLDAKTLLGPWAQPPVRKVVVAPPPAPVPQPAPPPPDKTSLRYLGTMVGEADVRTYLFKYLPTGKVLTLVEGVETDGWTLTQVDTKNFALKGPGGTYAVAR